MDNWNESKSQGIRGKNYKVLAVHTKWKVPFESMLGLV